MNTRKRDFSAQTEQSAAILRRGFDLAASSGFGALKFHGAWVDRCFVIARITLKSEMPEHPANSLAMTLTLPVTMSPAHVADACRSFGSVVESIWREVDHGKFDFVVSSDDADRHIVHRFNDVAVCGHRPRRWVSDDEVGQLENELQSCPKCITSSRPKT